MHLVVIGAGPAGEAAARRARQLAASGSLRITLVEKDRAGGLCLNRGCIPSKTLLEHVRKSFESGRPVDWTNLQAEKERVVSGIREQLESTLARARVDLVQGEARFTGASQLSIQSNGGSARLTFDKAIVTAGTSIFFPPPLDRFRDELLDSDRVLELRETPKSAVVIGGGAVGLEFACLLNAAGAKVVVVELTDGVLPGEDAAVASALARSFEARGISIRTGMKVETLEKTADGWRVGLSDGESLACAHVLACAGRAPEPDRFDFDRAGIRVDGRRIVLDKRLRTTNPNVFAAGDGTFTTRLAHAAAAQGEVAAENALGGDARYDDRIVPRCLYAWPEVASVGEWKHEREAQGRPVKASRAFYRGSAKALTAGDSDGFVQIVSEPETKAILGAQIIGAHATELIHIVAVAMKAGLTTAQLGELTFAHPTLSEMIKEACRKA